MKSQPTSLPRFLANSQTLLENSLHDYAEHRFAIGVKRGTIEREERTIKQFAKITHCGPEGWEPYLLEIVMNAQQRAGLKDATRLRNQSALQSYARYLADPMFPWKERYLRLLGAAITDPFVNGNARRHFYQPYARDVQPMLPEQYRKLFAYADALTDSPSPARSISAHRNAVMLKLALASGARRNELMTINRGDILRNASIPTYGDHGGLLIRNGKSKAFGPPRERTIYVTPVHDFIVKVLEQYTEMIRPEFPNVSERLFVKTTGEPITSNSASSMFAHYCREVGIPKGFGFHSLRRSFATELALEDYDGWFISEMLGHECPATTAQYLFFSSDFIMQYLRQLQARLLES